MQPLIGLKSIPELERLNTLKRYALLFDSFYATEHFDVTDVSAMRANASEPAQATFDFLVENEILKLPPKGKSIIGDDALEEEMMTVMYPYRERIMAHFASPSRHTFESVWDVFTRLRIRELGMSLGILATPILNQPPPIDDSTQSPTYSEVLNISLDYLPVPGPSTSWEQILDARGELREKLWGFRRFLRGLAGSAKTESETRDEIEWSLNEYRSAMKLNHLKTSRTALELFVIPPIEFAENIVKFNWSKIAKGALSIRKRKVELMEAEQNAPGREMAYVLETQKRFGNRS